MLIAGGVSNTVVYDSAELFAILPRGGTCVDDGECVTGFCGSGVCCETACKGACESCLAKEKGGGVDGTCGAVAAPCPPPVAPSCDGDHTLTNPAGSKNDCTPYKCAGSSCKITCDSVDDCVVPNLCDGRTRSCLLARDGATVDHGCTCHVGAPARSFAGSRAVAALLLGALVRRGRRKPVSLRFRSFLLGIKQRLGKKRPGSLHLAA